MSDFRVGDIVYAQNYRLTIEAGVVIEARYLINVDGFPFKRSELTLVKKAEIGRQQYNNHLVKCDLSTPTLLDNILIINEFIKVMVKQKN